MAVEFAVSRRLQGELRIRLNNLQFLLEQLFRTKKQFISFPEKQESFFHQKNHKSSAI